MTPPFPQNSGLRRKQLERKWVYAKPEYKREKFSGAVPALLREVSNVSFAKQGRASDEQARASSDFNMKSNQNWKIRNSEVMNAMLL